MDEDDLVLTLKVVTILSYNILTFSLPSLEVAVRKTDNFLLKCWSGLVSKNTLNRKYAQRISEQQDEYS